MKLWLFLLAVPLFAASTLIDSGSPTDSNFTGGVTFTIPRGVLNDFTVRSGASFSYTIPVQDIPYILTLGFVEPCAPDMGCSTVVNRAGQRVFSVTINDELRFPRLDVFAAVGALTVWERSTVIMPSNQSLVISFAGVTKTAVVSYIKLTPLFEIFGVQAAGPARRVLDARCTRCHGNDLVAGKVDGVGNLDLRTREAMLAGGNRGPALIPGDTEHSLIYKFASVWQMGPGPGGQGQWTPAQVLSSVMMATDFGWFRYLGPSDDWDDAVAMPPFFPITNDELYALRVWIKLGAP